MCSYSFFASYENAFTQLLTFCFTCDADFSTIQTLFYVLYYNLEGIQRQVRNLCVNTPCVSSSESFIYSTEIFNYFSRNFNFPSIVVVVVRYFKNWRFFGYHQLKGNSFRSDKIDINWCWMRKFHSVVYFGIFKANHQKSLKKRGGFSYQWFINGSTFFVRTRKENTFFSVCAPSLNLQRKKNFSFF